MRHILFATGFLQSKRNNSLAVIAGALRFKTSASISIHNWRDDAALLSKQLSQFDEVILIGYSFGGHLVAEVARQLGDKPIGGMFLCDAVSQPTSLSLSEWREKAIEVPPNVEKLWSWRQTSWYPRGSMIKVTPNTVWIRDAVLNNVRHGKMDVQPDFQDAINNFVIGTKWISTRAH